MLYSSVLETPIGHNDLSSLKLRFAGPPDALALARAFEAKTGVRIIEATA